jgi:hypothetical protein
MGVRRTINTHMWSDDWFESLSRDEKYLWVYLLTNPHTNMLGVYELTVKRMSFDTGLTIEAIQKAFKGFETVSKAFLISGKYVYLVNWIKNQDMNPNMVKSAVKDYKKLPIDVISVINRIVGEGFERVSNGLDTVRNLEGEIEGEIENENKPVSGYSPEFERAYELYERKGAKKEAYKSWLSMTEDERRLAVEAIPAYLQSKPEVKYRKDFERYLKTGAYEAKMIPASVTTEPTYTAPSYHKPL